MGLVVSSTLLVVSNTLLVVSNTLLVVSISTKYSFSSFLYSFSSYRLPLVFPITLLVDPNISILCFFCDLYYLQYSGVLMV